MDTIRLTHLVNLYWDCRKEIDRLNHTHTRNAIEMEILAAVDDFLKEKGKESSNQTEKQFLETIYDTLLTTDLAQTQNNAVNATFDQTAHKQKLFYLETKLTFIKNALGEAHLAELDRWETENILRWGSWSDEATDTEITQQETVPATFS
jgi:glutamyl/glutaminyl-tRNA synthetase